ncbi:hypothetical protein KJ632_03985 [Patescibacteria group bacterium]|nr:hypothetical protein [Patescibacteria group bacterium]
MGLDNIDWEEQGDLDNGEGFSAEEIPEEKEKIIVNMGFAKVHINSVVDDFLVPKEKFAGLKWTVSKGGSFSIKVPEGYYKSTYFGYWINLAEKRRSSTDNRASKSIAKELLKSSLEHISKLIMGQIAKRLNEKREQARESRSFTTRNRKRTIDSRIDAHFDIQTIDDDEDIPERIASSLKNQILKTRKRF